jgi:hypothetical protein
MWLIIGDGRFAVLGLIHSMVAPDGNPDGAWEATA